MAEESLPELRLSDRERDEVIAQLSQATSEGRLDLAEFEQRSKLVYAAKVPSELEGVLEGLPVVAAARPPAPGSVPLSPAPTAGKDRRWFFSLIGDRTHRGDLGGARRGTAVSVLGDTTFDLTAIDDGVIDLTVLVLIGDATLVVAPGTRVDSGGFVLLGDRDDELTSTPATGLTVRFRAYGLIGDVKIKVRVRQQP